MAYKLYDPDKLGGGTENANTSVGGSTNPGKKLTLDDITAALTAATNAAKNKNGTTTPPIAGTASGTTTPTTATTKTNTALAGRSFLQANQQDYLAKKIDPNDLANALKKSGASLSPDTGVKIDDSGKVTSVPMGTANVKLADLSSKEPAKKESTDKTDESTTSGGGSSGSSSSGSSATTDTTDAGSSSASSGSSLGQLLLPKYQLKTEEEIRNQATNETKSKYDALRLSANQAAETTDLALQQQLAGLQSTYDKQREESAKQYDAAYSKSDRQMLSRGMQRSSYAAQTLSNIINEGAKAQQNIYDEQATAASNIGAQRTQLATQLAQQLQSYDTSEQDDITKRINELQDTEYNRRMDVYNALYKAYTETRDYNEGVRQFDASLAEDYANGTYTGKQQASAATPTTPSGKKEQNDLPNANNSVSLTDDDFIKYLNSLM